MSEDWRNFDNDISVDIANLRPEDNVMRNLQKSIVFNYPDVERRTKLEPFKIVTLKWLIDIGKATPKNDNANLPANGTWGNYFMMIFSPSDKYLPVGDIYLQGKGSYDLNQIPVLLVKNDAYGKPNQKGDFCAIISKSAILEGWSGDHYKCNGGPDTRNFNIKPNGEYLNNYQVLGTFIAISGFWRPDWANYDGYNPAFVAVNKKYLKEIDGGAFNLGGDGGSRCYHNYNQIYSTPFYTFFKQSDKEEARRNGPGPFKVFDIVPRNLLASCCAKTVPDGINTDICGDYWSKPEVACIQPMKNSYCIGNNLNTAECKAYCKNNDCDTNLIDYCGAGTYEDQKKKYNEQKEICSCFMPRSFYEKKDDEKYSAMGPAGEKLKQLLIANNVYGDKPECSDLQCRVAGTTIQHKTFRGDAVDCRNLQIQNCINDASVNNKGKLQGSVSTDQANNCVQQSSSSSPTQQSPAQQQSSSSSPTQQSPAQQQSPSSSSPPTQQSENTMLYIIIGVVLLLIIIGVVVFLLMGDDSTPPPVVASRIFRSRK
jgi:hypothetical protein